MFVLVTCDKLLITARGVWGQDPRRDVMYNGPSRPATRTRTGWVAAPLISGPPCAAQPLCADHAQSQGRGTEAPPPGRPHARQWLSVALGRTAREWPQALFSAPSRSAAPPAPGPLQVPSRSKEERTQPSFPQKSADSSEVRLIINTVFPWESRAARSQARKSPNHSAASSQPHPAGVSPVPRAPAGPQL